MLLSRADGTATVILDADAAGAGEIRLRRGNGATSLVLDADHQGTGKSRVIADVIEIVGGADLAEGFDTGLADCAPGTVLAIDPAQPGRLVRSSQAYDTRVAGVVSGAGGVDPGLRLGQASVMDGDTPVALSGRVYVQCTSENGAIRPGDLLTTAHTAGHAMKATDRERAFGGVIGKAMSALDAETGLVLVLVNLQ